MTGCALCENIHKPINSVISINCEKLLCVGPPVMYRLLLLQPSFPSVPTARCILYMIYRLYVCICSLKTSKWHFLVSLFVPCTALVPKPANIHQVTVWPIGRMFFPFFLHEPAFKFRGRSLVDHIIATVCSQVKQLLSEGLWLTDYYFWSVHYCPILARSWWKLIHVIVQLRGFIVIYINHAFLSWDIPVLSNVGKKSCLRNQQVDLAGFEVTADQ